MTVFCLGSINADFTYGVAHVPGPGETVLATSVRRGLGGKGANQSVAAVRSGSDVRHIGMVGPDGDWCVQDLSALGVDVSHVGVVETPTAHANIAVDTSGENAIIVFPGANHEQDLTAIETALNGAGPGDWLMLQNETDLVVDTARQAVARGVQVAYSAAPFDAEAVAKVLPFVTLLILNALEAAQLEADLGDVSVPWMVITRGAEGATWRDERGSFRVAAPKVAAVDTTGAGDTFAGYLVAGLAAGQSPRAAMERAAKAAALQVTKKGTAEAIPSLSDVQAFSG